jgi:hypothetical protein
MFEILAGGMVGATVVAGLYFLLNEEDFPSIEEFKFIAFDNIPVSEKRAVDDALEVFSRLISDYFILFPYKGRWVVGTRQEKAIVRIGEVLGRKTEELQKLPDFKPLHLTALSVPYLPLESTLTTGNALLQASVNSDAPPILVLGRPLKSKEYKKLFENFAVEKPTPADKKNLKLLERKTSNKVVVATIYATKDLIPDLKAHVGVSGYLWVSEETVAPEDFEMKKRAWWLNSIELSRVFSFPYIGNNDVEKLLAEQSDVVSPIPFKPPYRFNYERERKVKGIPEKDKIHIGTHIHTLSEVYINKETLTEHSFIQGQTGSGKSWVLMQIILEWLKDPQRSTILIDPNGSTVERVVERMPDNQLEKTIIVDLAKSERGIPLFSLPPAPSKSLPRALRREIKLMIYSLPNQVGNILYRFMMSQSASMSQHMFREFVSALWLLQVLDIATLDNLIEFFSVDDAFRQQVIKEGVRLMTRAKNDYIRRQGEKIKADWDNFYAKWYKKGELTSQGQAHLTGLQGYVSSLANSPATMRMFNRAEWGINLEEVFFQGKNLFIIMPRGSTEQSIPLAMALLYNLFRNYTNVKQAIPERKRKYTLIAIDEAHNIGSILAQELSQDLAEFRKYHTALLLATQFLGQFTNKRLREEVINNTNLQVVLRMKPQVWASLHKIYNLSSPVELAFARKPSPRTGGAVGLVVVDNGKEWVKFVNPNDYPKLRDFYQEYEKFIG